MLEPAESLSSLFALAAGVGVVHTIAGPDHYLPVIAAARLRDWSSRRALARTAMLGLVHCLTSVVVLVAALAFFGGVVTESSALATTQDVRSDVTAGLLIASGAVLGGLGWRTFRRGVPDRTLGAATSRMRLALLLIFAIGPCEWLLLPAVAAAASHGAVGALAAAGVFTVATVVTMVVAVAFGLAILPRWRLRPGLGELAAGATFALCGALILIGL